MVTQAAQTHQGIACREPLYAADDLQLRERSDPQRWAAERHAVLEARWPAKAFLRMRLSDTSDDVHGHMANPLARPPA